MNLSEGLVQSFPLNQQFHVSTIKRRTFSIYPSANSSPSETRLVEGVPAYARVYIYIICKRLAESEEYELSVQMNTCR